MTDLSKIPAADDVAHCINCRYLVDKDYSLNVGLCTILNIDRKFNANCIHEEEES